MSFKTFAALSPLLLLLLVFGACPPPDGALDDDDVGPSDDDDDDDDDDATPPGDDDDFTVPEGTPLGGVVSYQPNDGAVPTASIRVGMFLGTGFEPQSEERYSAEISAEGLSGGDTIFTIYVEGEPPDSDYEALPGVDAEAASYFLLSYADSDGDGGWSESDQLLGSSMTLLVAIRYEGSRPDELETWGADAGWNTAEWTDLTDGDESVDFDHAPLGTNSATGPEIQLDLLPNEGGSIPVSTEVLLPTGSAVAAFHSSLFDGVPVPDFELFTQAASNFELRGEALVDWDITGAPPSSHLAVLDDDENNLGVLGASYVSVGFFDDGDLSYTASTCDTLLAAGATRFLIWIEPSSLTPSSAFVAQRSGMPMGWSLYDEELEAWRLFAAGISLGPVDALGDDDDSAPGDDDDSAAGDDDDSAAPPDLGIPEECLPPPGDDDDSAGDDDDSAGDDDDSA